MSGDPLPPEIQKFIVRHIASVEELEILLLLFKERDPPCTAESAYQVIKSSRQSVQLGLDKFLEAGFVESVPGDPPGYTFKATESESLIHELNRCYQEKPVRVIGAIYQRTRDFARDFADAFKFKRDQ